MSIQLAAQDAKQHAWVVGTWDAKAETDGNGDYQWTIAASDEGLTGVMRHKDQEYQVNNIKVDGNKLTFDIDIEADGDSVRIKVSMRRGKHGDLSGSWTAMENDNEVASGKVTAIKKQVASFKGTWNAFASHPDGNGIETELTLDGSGNEMTGSFVVNDRKIDFDKITCTDNTIRMAFEAEIQGQSRKMVIEASSKGKDALEGVWMMKGDDCENQISGDWKATRVDSKGSSARL